LNHGITIGREAADLNRLPVEDNPRVARWFAASQERVSIDQVLNNQALVLQFLLDRADEDP
jgi:hypothetical protein